MSGVLALALKRMSLSHGTAPSAVPVGQAIASGTNGPLRTLGTLSDASLDGGPVDPAAIKERAALAAVSVPPGYLDAWTQLQYHRPLSVTGFALLHAGRDGWSGEDWRAFFDERVATGGHCRVRRRGAAPTGRSPRLHVLRRRMGQPQPGALAARQLPPVRRGRARPRPAAAVRGRTHRPCWPLGMPPDRPRPSPRFLRWVSRHEEITMSTKQTAANDLPF